VTTWIFVAASFVAAGGVTFAILTDNVYLGILNGALLSYDVTAAIRDVARRRRERQERQEQEPIRLIGSVEQWDDVTDQVHEPEADVPDSITPVLGFRQWTLDSGTGILRSRGGYSGVPWERGETVAYCAAPYIGAFSKPREPHGPVPKRACGCGLYAQTDWQDLELPTTKPIYGETQVTVTTYGSISTPTTSSTKAQIGTEAHSLEDLDDPVAIGVVRGYGRTMLHKKGWRAEKASVVALIDPCAALPWHERDERYHKLLEQTAKNYDVPILDHMPSLEEFA
jgi:hypothetical protein